MGKAQSTLGFVSKLVFSFGFSQLSKGIYKASLAFFPGLVFVVFAGLYLANAVNMVFVQGLLKKAARGSKYESHGLEEAEQRLQVENEGASN